jgi:hypothetical protein
MKQCPTCGQMLWLEADGLWHCNNCNTAVALRKGDKIFRICEKCAPPERLQFDHQTPKGHLFGCPNCEFTMCFS